MAMTTGKFVARSTERNVFFKCEADAIGPLDMGFKNCSLVDMGSSNEMPAPPCPSRLEIPQIRPQGGRRADERFGVELQGQGPRSSDVHQRAQSQGAVVAALQLRPQFVTGQVLTVRVVQRRHDGQSKDSHRPFRRRSPPVRREQLLPVAVRHVELGLEAEAHDLASAFASYPAAECQFLNP